MKKYSFPEGDCCRFLKKAVYTLDNNQQLSANFVHQPILQELNQERSDGISALGIAFNRL